MVYCLAREMMEGLIAGCERRRWKNGCQQLEESISWQKTVENNYVSHRPVYADIYYKPCKWLPIPRRRVNHSKPWKAYAPICFKVINECLDACLGSTQQVTLKCIRGHQGIKSNEREDLLSKRGAKKRLVGPESTWRIALSTSICIVESTRTTE